MGREVHREVVREREGPAAIPACAAIHTCPGTQQTNERTHRQRHRHRHRETKITAIDCVRLDGTAGLDLAARGPTCSASHGAHGVWRGHEGGAHAWNCRCISLRSEGTIGTSGASPTWGEGRTRSARERRARTRGGWPAFLAWPGLAWPGLAGAARFPAHGAQAGRKESKGKSRKRPRNALLAVPTLHLPKPKDSGPRRARWWGTWGT